MKFKGQLVGAALTLSIASTASPFALMAMDAGDDANAFVEMLETRADGEIEITYGNASTVDGNTVLTDLVVTKADGEQVANATSATLGQMSSGTPSFVELKGLNITGDSDAVIGVDNIRMEGASAIEFALTVEDIDSPFDILNAMTGTNRITLSGLNVKSDDDDNVSIASLDMLIDGTEQVLEKFMIQGVSVAEGDKDNESVNIDNITIEGPRFGAIAALVMQYDTDKSDTDAINALIEKVADEAPSAMGLKTFNINGISVIDGRGSEVSVGEIAVENMRYHNGSVISADVRVSNTGVHNNDEAKALGMDGFVVDMTASETIAEDGRSVTGNLDVTLRDGVVLNINQSAEIESLDSYVAERETLIKNQVRSMLQEEFLKKADRTADIDPLAGLFLHESLKMEVKVTDLGMVAAAIAMQAEKSGQTVDLLAMQAPMVLPMFLAGQLPEDQIIGLSQEVSSFITGTPFHVVFDTVDGWRETVADLVENGDPKAVKAQNIVSVSFPAE